MTGGYPDQGAHYDAWEWNGVDWKRVAAAKTPPRRYSTGMCFDGSRAVGVWYGCYTGQTPVGDLWEWDGRQWLERFPSTSPTPRIGFGMTFDAARNRTIMVGGCDSLQQTWFADTWSWDGTNWTQHVPPSSPPPRAGLALGYDADRKVVVLFGGLVGTSWLADTWEWDGRLWTQRSPTNSPPPRAHTQLAYDARRKRMVLFGGSQQFGYLGDTWEWDGVSWQQRFPVTSPSSRWVSILEYDTVRQRVVLHGGNAVSDTWEWDGNNWLLVSPSGGPNPAVAPAAAYDSRRRQLVALSGTMTWTFGFAAPAGATSFGSACAGSAGLPALGSNEPYFDNPRFVLDLLSARPSSACAFALASSSQSLPIGGGCTLYVKDPILPVLAATNAFGFATTSFAVPWDPALRGVAVYAQAFVADPRGPVLGLALSAGRRLLLGD